MDDLMLDYFHQERFVWNALQKSPRGLEEQKGGCKWLR